MCCKIKLNLIKMSGIWKKKEMYATIRVDRVTVAAMAMWQPWQSWQSWQPWQPYD